MSKASLELGGTNWAAKEGNLLGYAQGNESDKFIPREFSFTRAADIAATRVNSSGLIEKYRENLAKNTNWEGASLDTAPTDYTGYLLSNGTFNTTSTEGQIRFTTDSSSRAIVITSNISETGIFTQSVYVDEVYTSIYVKDVINRSANATAIGYYEDGVEITATTSVQTGKRYSIVWNKTGAASFRFGSGVNGAKVGDIVLSRPQIERGLVATELIVSPVGSTGKTGVLDNLPRIDYTGGTASLLLEPQRTNLVTHSEYFEASDWNTAPNGVAISADVTTNYAISPQGIQNATRLRLDLNGGTANSDRSRIKADFGIGTSGSQAHSIYIKSNDGVTQNVTFRSLGTLTNHEITSDWKRIDLVTTDNSLYFELGIYGNTSYNDTADLLIWGAQIEEGSYPTSYIPTYGTSDTRAEDTFQNNTNDKPLGAIGQGTWFVELQKLGDDTNQALYLAPTTSNTQQIRLHFDASNARFRDARNGFATIGGGVNVKTSMTKMALSIDTTSGIAKVYANGSQLGSDYTLQANTFEFSRIVAEGKGFILKQSLFFPNALSGSELAALTT